RAALFFQPAENDLPVGTDVGLFLLPAGTDAGLFLLPAGTDVGLFLLVQMREYLQHYST
ncbi:hypothetical protein Tco_0518732, partial [Tanacetum coccineum]